MNTKEKIKEILSKYDIEMIQYADKDNEKLLEELVDLFDQICQEAKKQVISEYQKGLRCIHCGALKKSNLTEMCHKCISEL